jgi:Protein of unknown function (DUF3037)
VAREPFQYAVIRIVPRVERGEFVNAGVILFCRTRGFLEARTELDEQRLLALDPEIELDPLRRQLETLVAVAAGLDDAGSIARLEPSERFHWLASPSSTVIQTSPVHSGLSDDPEQTLEHLMQTLVRASP